MATRARPRNCDHGCFRLHSFTTSLEERQSSSFGSVGCHTSDAYALTAHRVYLLDVCQRHVQFKTASARKRLWQSTLQIAVSSTARRPRMANASGFPKPVAKNLAVRTRADLLVHVSLVAGAALHKQNPHPERCNHLALVFGRCHLQLRLSTPLSAISNRRSLVSFP